MMNYTFAMACLATLAHCSEQTCTTKTTDIIRTVIPTATFEDGSFKDKLFGTDDSSIFWGDFGESQIYPHALQWQRAYDSKASRKAGVLFGETISPSDVIQGWISDSEWMSTVAALAQTPSRIEKVFGSAEKELCKTGRYEINLWPLGVKRTIVVDDYLPMRDTGFSSSGW
mmetsp:Transcript_14172/g.16885  ORF Transcript_14172/g.16885 Transcript_14172/m.16885 type:complete len:171 (-) Transcript_14172:1406-1918(-)